MEYVKKNFLLLLGSLCLIGAWFWEKNALASYQEKIQKAWRFYGDFERFRVLEQINDNHLNALISVYNIDPKKQDTISLLSAYANCISIKDGVYDAGEVIKGTKFNSQDHIKASLIASKNLEQMIKNRESQKLMWLYNKMDDTVLKLSNEAIGIFNQRIINLEDNFGQSSITQQLLYAIGIALVFFNSRIGEAREDKEDNQIGSKLDNLTSKVNKIVEEINRRKNRDARK